MYNFGKQMAINSVWWIFVLLIWMTIVDTALSAEHHQIHNVLPTRVIFTVLVGLIMALLNTIMDWWMDRRDQTHKISFRKKLIILFIRQMLFIAFVAVLIYTVVKLTFDMPPSSDFRDFFQRFRLGSFWLYSVFGAYTLDMIKAIDQKLGPGNLWKMMIGRFSKPKEMEKIFMFLDLQGSTSLAERLGNILYSEMIQDCFHDISVVRRHGAEVFQYVGDEVVLVWPPNQGLNSFNCIEAYFAFMRRINDKSEYYESKYGTVPFFKAGIHKGKVVLAEVGEIKREIAYHGDTINTASRIQDKCNEFNQSLVISQELLNAFDSEEMEKVYSIKELGTVSLKGKDNTVNISGLQKIA